MSSFELQGRSAVVTGGSGVLGEAMARGLAAAGGRLDILVNAAGGNLPDATVFGDPSLFGLQREAFRWV